MAGAAFVLVQNPLARPFMDRSAQATQIALDRAVASVATPDWLVAHLEAAIAADDEDRIQMYLDLAQDQNITLPPDLTARANAAQAFDVKETLGDCAACATDPGKCPSLSMTGACFIPIQVSPVGDVMALSQQGWAWATGGEVDEIDAGLAALGLAATTATVVTAGSALPVKLGISTLRVARRADAISPGMTRTLRAALRESGGMERAGGIAADATRIVGATSAAQALPILKMADSAPELTRLARLSEITQTRTLHTLEVLGKARTLRLMHRISDLALAAFGLLAALTAQLGALLGTGIKLALRHAAR